ncbi:MAG: HAMP domain-containing histidine kinase [Alphaproteobacteria bacterium]|nr:HAMP domain-containing histidine kinase [Alphaproteobacteria bacterium]
MENEEKRVALEKMRQDLLANISHDLRTPLTSIISYIDILKNQELSGDAVEYVEIIDNKANVLRNMVDDIVYLSKLTSGSMHVNMEKINLKCFLEQVLFEWKVDNEQLADFIEYTVVGEETIVENDGSKLYRVFQNLLDNVVKYKKENSIIEIKYENIDERYVTIEIKNESSYPLQFQGDDMLERFVRADRTRNSEGHGLGLAIATELVKLCKGKMEIKVEEVFFIVKLSFEKIG